MMNLDIATKIIEDSAKLHAHASLNGDYKAANKHYDRISEAIAFLRANDGLKKLYELLFREDVNVKLAAASYLLSHDEKIAIPILEGIAESEIPHSSFSAKMVLSEWENGNLNL